MKTVAALAESLKDPRSPSDADLAAIRDRVRGGLPYSMFESLAKGFRVPVDELGAVLDIPKRTLARRKRERRFRSGESDRLVRLARVAAIAAEVFGSPEQAGRWLRDDNIALGGDRPLRWLDTDAGAREVEHLLGRIEHGICS